MPEACKNIAAPYIKLLDLASIDALFENRPDQVVQPRRRRTGQLWLFRAIKKPFRQAVGKPGVCVEDLRPDRRTFRRGLNIKSVISRY